MKRAQREEQKDKGNREAQVGRMKACNMKWRKKEGGKKSRNKKSVNKKKKGNGNYEKKEGKEKAEINEWERDGGREK